MVGSPAVKYVPFWQGMLTVGEVECVGGEVSRGYVGNLCTFYSILL
jgi:hypothetical protein